jgi:hypothetical protein
MKFSKDKKPDETLLLQKPVLSEEKKTKKKPRNSNDRICVRLFYCQALRLSKINKT